MRENYCLYLFRLESSAVCPAVQSKLSTGSIILIMCVNMMTHKTSTIKCEFFVLSEIILGFFQWVFSPDGLPHWRFFVPATDCWS